MPEPTSRRPIGLGKTLWNLLNTPNEAGAQPAKPNPTPPMARDGFQATAAFANARFANQPDLALLMAGQVLRPGSSSQGVAAVQGALHAMGFTIADGATGYYGNQTQAALRNFQVMAGLPADGILGPNTMKALDRHAPPPGKNSWDAGVNPGPVPNPTIAPGKQARVVVSISQHRAFLFDANGKLKKIYGVRTGTPHHADGRGGATTPGVRQITGKNGDPTSVSQALWPESNGKAFGTRLIDLTLVDPVTGKLKDVDGNGQELHGTYTESSIGLDYSHGCVGLRNRDIEEIYGQVRNGEFVRFDA
ncbi:MAG: L,D-transpeptidase family protein [Candidatus Sericytochromatia bacterium]|nr:L,D-transpeptidase family protein [Candidatus Sericytochromatia bacterium]